MDIQLQDVSRSFRDVVALDGISLEIRSAELVALVGRSGCGKTTLLRICAGLEDLDRGEVRFGDNVVANQGRSVPPERRNVGFVFQSFALWPHMKVFDNIAYGLRRRKLKSDVIESRVREVLDMTGLEGLGERFPHELSGGQQQRVSLSRALALQPDVLLMDEPLSNLDANLRRRVGREIREIQQRLGVTTIYVTHDMEEAMVLADRIVVMKDGQIQQVGKPLDVYMAPRDPFVANFTGEMNWITGIVPEERGSHWLMDGDVGLISGAPPRVVDSSSARRLQVGIRPEDLWHKKTTPSEEAVSQLAGRVEEVVPTRRGVEVVVDVSGQIVRTLTTARAAPSEGDQIMLQVPSERFLVFEAGKEDRPLTRREG